ncbi:MAG: Biotin carboxyl carrier protein of acetyl-CoA carboxylase [Elusimicrobia bacterium]|nr:Biotin carboxyl carrier protein of acetyl-CoA carboxylase [Elusimicrobiota bacterium]
MNSSTVSKLQELLQVAKRHGLMEMVWKEGDVKIAFRRGGEEKSIAISPESPVPQDTPETTPERILVKSPIVGTFRRSSGKGRPPLVLVGNNIKPGDPLGVVECMKIPTDVVSFIAGEIKEILVEDGQPVEYGQPLFSIEAHV